MPRTAYISCIVIPDRPEKSRADIPSTGLSSLPRRCIFPSAVYAPFDIWIPREHVEEIGAFYADGIMDMILLRPLRGDIPLSAISLAPIGVVEVEIMTIDEIADRVTVRIPGQRGLAAFPMSHVFEYDREADRGSGRKVAG